MNSTFLGILGACVGDAAGATLEGRRQAFTEEVVLNAMKMPGGGPLYVGPGQITDDGELTLALWKAIKNYNPKDGFPILSIMKTYANWYDSFPFDIGQTCSFAFEAISDLFKAVKSINEDDIYTLKWLIYNLNRESEANGALMRATSLATWIAKYEDIDPFIGAEMAMEDATLSHPSEACKEVNAIYVYTLINLLREISPPDALKYTNEFIKMNEFSEKVRHWYFEESFDISKMDCTIQAGHVRWGFVMSFYFLRNPEITYEEAIKITLLKGGDTDTNAAIVGGLVGAYHIIPEYMLNPVLDFDCITVSEKHHTRPIEYSVKNVLKNSC